MIKRIKKIFKRAFWLFLILLILLVVSLYTPYTQRYLANYLNDYLNETYDAGFEIEKVEVKPESLNVTCKNVLIRDHHKDTLIYVRDLYTNYLDAQTLKGHLVQLGDLHLQDYLVRIKTYKGETDNSIVVFRTLSKKNTERPVKPPFVIASRTWIWPMVDFNLSMKIKRRFKIW